MTKNRRMLCWLLLLALLSVQWASLAVGQTYARYDSTVVASTVVESKPHGITSDCMVKAGDPSLTVLVGALDGDTPQEKEKEVSFWLKSNGADAVGELLWSVEEPEKYLQYVQITMQIDGVTVDPGEQIDLLRDVPMSFDMTIAPTAIAETAEHEELKVNVLVTWGDEMWGTFQVIIPEVPSPEAATTPTTPTESTDPADPTNPTNPTDPTDPANSGMSDTEKASREALANLLEAQNEAEGETTPPTTEPENTSPETTEPPATTEPTKATTPTEPTVDPSDPIQLKTISRFDPAQQLPVKIQISEDITSVRLGRETEDGEFEPLPDNTMLSLDNGKGYYMLYDGYVAEFSPQELELQDPTTIPVLLDFTHTDLEEDDTLVLEMQAYSEAGLQATRRAETTADARKSCLTLTHPLDTETWDVVFTEGDTRESAAAAEQYGWRSGILTYNNALEFVLPMEWLDAELEYSAEMLTMTEEQTLEYVPVTLSEAGLYGKFQDFDQTHNLVLRIGESLPQAGTYRLNMKWSYEGICFSQTQTTFFINYSVNTAQILSG